MNTLVQFGLALELCVLRCERGSDTQCSFHWCNEALVGGREETASAIRLRILGLSEGCCEGE